MRPMFVTLVNPRNVLLKRPEALLCSTPGGLYCPPGDFYIDPVRPVDRALITHGHSDHARAGHGSVLATRQTLDIMGLRYGEDFAGATQAADLGERPPNQRRLRQLPSGRPCAGLGADRVEHDGMRIVASGDYKRQRRSHLPALRAGPLRRLHHRGDLRPAGVPPSAGQPRRDRQAAQIRRAVSRARASRRRLCARQGAARHPADPRCRLRQADLHPRRAGEALRLLPERRASISATCDRRRSRRQRQGDFAGAIVVGPPSAFADRWARRFPDPISCFASGWMRIRQRAKQGGVELPLIISDHSDWDELTDTIIETGASRDLGHARPRGGAGALVRARRASPRGRCISSATRTRGDLMAGTLRRTPRPPGADARAQRQADAARRLFPRRRGPRPRAGAGRASPAISSIAAVKPAMLRALDRRAHGPGAVRLFLRLCRRSRRNRLAGLARSAGARAPNHRADARRGRRNAAVGQPLGRAERARAPARQRRHPARFAIIKLVTGGLRIGVSARLAKQALADFGKVDVAEIEELWHGLTPPYRELFAWLEGKRRKPREARPRRCSARSCCRKPVEDRDLEKLDPADYAAEWKWDGIRVQAVVEGGMRRLYSRTGDDMSGAFPDLVEAMNFDAALDGELLVGASARARPALSPTCSSGSTARPCRRRCASSIRPSCAATTCCSDGDEDHARPALHRAARSVSRPSSQRSTRRASTCRRSSHFADWEALDEMRKHPPHPVIEGRHAEAAAIRPISPAGRRVRGSSGSAIRTRSTRC